MKKILMLIVMATIPSIAFATIEEFKTNDIELLRHQGYSESTLRVLDDVTYRNQGKDTKYKKHFTNKKQTKAGRAYINIKNYVDPIQDDNIFGAHQINFTNTWNGDETHYSKKRTDSQVEDL